MQNSKFQDKNYKKKLNFIKDLNFIKYENASINKQIKKLLKKNVCKVSKKKM